MAATTCRVIDPDGLTSAQRTGAACYLCHKCWPRPTAFFGQLPDGTPIFVCVECDVPYSPNGDER